MRDKFMRGRRLLRPAQTSAGCRDRAEATSTPRGRCLRCTMRLRSSLRAAADRPESSTRMIDPNHRSR
jgi:hypothetical protein